MSEHNWGARPEWWPAWTDYPHGGLSEKQARQLSGYAVKLEEELQAKAALAGRLLAALRRDRYWSGEELDALIAEAEAAAKPTEGGANV